MATANYPVHDEVTVHSGETIYRTDDWWKAAVTHSFDSGDPEIAIYLWHKDEDWSRKNKYHVKTAEAWHADKEKIETYLDDDGASVTEQSAFPVNEYYNISQGESVFKSDGWWKSIVSIDQKGSYDTQEVIIYLWQQVDGDWRRRQKYAIKNLDDWSDDRDAVDTLLDDDIEQVASVVADQSDSTEDLKTLSEADSINTNDEILADLEAEVKDLHLGSGVTK